MKGWAAWSGRLRILNSGRFWNHCTSARPFPEPSQRLNGSACSWHWTTDPATRSSPASGSSRSPNCPGGASKRPPMSFRSDSVSHVSSSSSTHGTWRPDCPCERRSRIPSRHSQTAMRWVRNCVDASPNWSHSCLRRGGQRNRGAGPPTRAHLDPRESSVGCHPSRRRGHRRRHRNRPRATQAGALPTTGLTRPSVTALCSRDASGAVAETAACRRASKAGTDPSFRSSAAATRTRSAPISGSSLSSSRPPSSRCTWSEATVRTSFFSAMNRLRSADAGSGGRPAWASPCVACRPGPGRTRAGPPVVDRVGAGVRAGGVEEVGAEEFRRCAGRRPRGLGR